MIASYQKIAGNFLKENLRLRCPVPEEKFLWKNHGNQKI